MIVYNQKILSGPPVLYLGEDAYPYDEDGILLVADGLGGRGGYPHTKVDRRILDKDNFFHYVFGDVFSLEVHEEFKEFVVNSFSEIFETKHHYFHVEAATRTSGYFASRLAAAIALYEIKYMPGYNRDKLFAAISAGGDDVGVIIGRYAKKLTANIKDKLEYIAQNIGLVIETKLTGAYLLPTTLQLALIKEYETTLDVVYLWAGDSRAYFWNEDGLAQITDDHENNGTMYNLINLSKDYEIEARYISFKKPCILFNATDGCYKCSAYSSPLDMEMTFLKVFSKASGPDEVSSGFRDEYKLIGGHDDSNTMALGMYGYKGADGAADFGRVKEAVNKRLQYIETMKRKLPDIFNADYARKQEELQEKSDAIIFGNSFSWIDLPAVKTFVYEMMKSVQYEPYIKAMRENEEEKEKPPCIPANGNSPERHSADVRCQISEKLKDKKEEQTEQYVKRFWRARRKEITGIIWGRNRQLLQKDEVNEILSQLDALQQANSDLIRNIQIRDAIYSEYEKHYFRYFKGARI